jgi:hypothetical protein
MAQLTADEHRLGAMGSAAAAAVGRVGPEAFAVGLATALEAGRRYAAGRGKTLLPRVSLWL